MSKSLLLILFLAPKAAADLPLIKVGDGAKYELSLLGQNTEIAIAVVNSSKSKTAIEIFMSTPGMIKLQMWQQFHLKKTKSGPLEISEGYVYFDKLEKPQKLTPEYLHGYNDGAQMQDFLFSQKHEIEKHKIGSGEIEIKAGKVKVDQYRIVSNGQTIEFWISDDAKPLGLVKLISSGSKPQQNYSIEMTTLFSGIKAKIDPKTANPLDQFGKSFLPKPGKKLFFH